MVEGALSAARDLDQPGRGRNGRPAVHLVPARHPSQRLGPHFRHVADLFLLDRHAGCVSAATGGHVDCLARIPAEADDLRGHTPCADRRGLPDRRRPGGRGRTRFPPGVLDQLLLRRTHLRGDCPDVWPGRRLLRDSAQAAGGNHARTAHAPTGGGAGQEADCRGAAVLARIAHPPAFPVQHAELDRVADPRGSQARRGHDRQAGHAVALLARRQPAKSGAAGAGAARGDGLPGNRAGALRRAPALLDRRPRRTGVRRGAAARAPVPGGEQREARHRATTRGRRDPGRGPRGGRPPRAGGRRHGPGLSSGGGAARPRPRQPAIAAARAVRDRGWPGDRPAGSALAGAHPAAAIRPGSETHERRRTVPRLPGRRRAAGAAAPVAAARRDRAVPGSRRGQRSRGGAGISCPGKRWTCCSSISRCQG